MKQEQFETLLSQVAEWSIPDCLDNVAERTKVRRMVKSMIRDGHTSQEVEQALSEYKNSTIPPELGPLKPRSIPCGDCGRDCPNGRQVDYKLIKNYKLNLKKWCGKCYVCHLQSNPWTGEFDVDYRAAGSVWSNWQRSASGQRQERKVNTKTPIDLAALKKKYGLDLQE